MRQLLSSHDQAMLRVSDAHTGKQGLLVALHAAADDDDDADPLHARSWAPTKVSRSQGCRLV